MSLINKMLKDLEARQSGTQPPDPQSIYKGLRSSSRSPVRSRLWVVVLLGGVVLAVAGGWLGWQSWRASAPDVSAPTVTPETATAPAAVTPPLRTETPKPRPAKATHPSKPMVSASASHTPAPATAIEVNSRGLSKEDQAENLYREGIQFIRQSHPDDAEQRLRAALVQNPAHVLARESLAAVLVEQGRWLEAQSVLEEGLRILPNQVSFGFLLARLYVEQNKDAAGLQLLERLQPHAGENPDFLAFMATLYQRTGRHAEAVNYFRKAMTTRPVEGRWWVGLGISLEALNDRENARAAYQRANTLALDPRLAAFVAERLKQISSR